MKLNTLFKKKINKLFIFSIISIILTLSFIYSYQFFIGKNIDFFTDHERYKVTITLPQKNMTWDFIRNNNNHIVSDYNPAIGKITFKPQEMSDIVNKVNEERLISFDTTGTLPSNSKMSYIKAINLNGSLKVEYEGKYPLKKEVIYDSLKNFLKYYSLNFNQNVESQIKNYDELINLLSQVVLETIPKFENKESIQENTILNYKVLLDRINQKLSCYQELLNTWGNQDKGSKFFLDNNCTSLIPKINNKKLIQIETDTNYKFLLNRINKKIGCYEELVVSINKWYFDSEFVLESNCKKIIQEIENPTLQFEYPIFPDTLYTNKLLENFITSGKIEPTSEAINNFLIELKNSNYNNFENNIKESKNSLFNNQTNTKNQSFLIVIINDLIFNSTKEKNRINIAYENYLENVNTQDATINSRIFNLVMQKNNINIKLEEYLRNIETQDIESASARKDSKYTDLVDKLLFKRLQRVKKLIEDYQAQHLDYILLKNADIKESTLLIKGKKMYIFPIHYIVIFFIILAILFSINSMISIKSRNEE